MAPCPYNVMVDGVQMQAIIGPDGNVDYIGEKILSGERVREIILNNHSVQTKSRRPLD